MLLVDILLHLYILAYQVSLGSELSNRGPTFDMDMADFMDGGQPISFQKAKQYFDRDPSQRCVTLLLFTFQIPLTSSLLLIWFLL